MTSLPLIGVEWLPSITMTAEPAGDHFAHPDRTQIARRILDDTQRMLAMALQRPEMVDLIYILEQTRDEAERVLGQTLKPI